ncbi:hypothetical protein PLICRDRAFT_102852 [Plicaturopsis crispa FD-325 SS-3]|nr:hypothetical protein PLICRDRAFT_102852 [Plicaturopsis crispa FD-325 SS-3]
MSTPPPVYDNSRSVSQSTTTLKPYLQLPHLLSLTWLAYPILSLLFVAFRLQLSVASSQDSVASAKGDLLTSCRAAEQAATSAASMPRFMAAATNQQIADAVNGTMNAARATLVLSLTIMETIINFIVDIYRSTFLCFLELVVRGGLSILISAVQEITNAVQSTVSGIRTNIQNDVASANSAIQSVVNGLNKLKVFGNVSVPQFNIPSLDALQNVTIPTDFENALISLNSSLPSIDDLKNAIDSIIDTPFEAVKADINQTFGNLSFDASTLPVPQQNTLSFCGDLDTSVIDDLGRDILKAAKIGTLILILLVLLLLAGNCALEWYKWRCLKRHLQYTREAWVSDPTMYHSGPAQGTPTVTLSDHNLLMLQASGAHPLLTRIANTLAAKLRLSPSQHTHLQWFFHYIFHAPALACFLIGFFGLLSVQLQLIAIGPLEAKYTKQAAASVSDFSNTIATSMNASMYNQSSAYANDINGRVDTIQQTINEGLFGWVNGTTTTLNSTLNTFYDDIQNSVTKVFNGTILESPVQEFVRCFIGSKVDAFEEALTFLHDNLQINIARVNDSVLVLSPADVDEATRPIATAAIGGGNDDSQGVVGRLIAAYVNSLKKERIMFAIFMGLWGVVVLMALCIIFWHSYGQHWLEAHRRRKWLKEQRGMDGLPDRFRDAGNEKGDMEKQAVDLPSFTPMPSPKPSMSFNPFRRSTKPPAQNPNLLRANHPLNTLDRNFERSWDTFVDHNDVAQDYGSKPKPNKLLAIGRKAMGRERFVRDQEPSLDNEREAEQAETNGWLGRVKGKLARARTDDSGEPSFQAQRSRPNLTITTEHLSANVAPHAPPADARDQGPSSAWSVSPTPPRAPWMNIISSTRKVVPHAPGLPLRPKPRRNASVPNDVDADADEDVTASVLPGPTPLAVPIHHGFERRESWVTPGELAPPVDRHRRSVSVPIATWDDPFATPFDDEARVQQPARPERPTNPFAPVAY